MYSSVRENRGSIPQGQPRSCAASSCVLLGGALCAVYLSGEARKRHPMHRWEPPGNLQSLDVEVLLLRWRDVLRTSCCAPITRLLPTCCLY